MGGRVLGHRSHGLQGHWRGLWRMSRNPRGYKEAVVGRDIQSKRWKERLSICLWKMAPLLIGRRTVDGEGGL